MDSLGGEVVPIKNPWEMTWQEFQQEWDRLSRYAQQSERLGGLDPFDRQSYQRITIAEQELLDQGNWRAFSQGRGYSEGDIAQYQSWRVLSGAEHDLPHWVNDPWRRDWGVTQVEDMYVKHVNAALDRGAFVPQSVLDEVNRLRPGTT